MSYPRPPLSKAAVRRSGKAISQNNSTDADMKLVDEWRAAHGFVINTFQSWLKRHIKKQNFEVEFAQRLKRRKTVVDKLRRKDLNGNPLISDVTSMHDLAGCRMIFNSIEDLSTFRAYLHSTPVMRNVEHTLRHELDKYDYISHPKSTGYRGIHDVFKHFPRGHRRNEVKKPWDGLLVELQYRTRAQHAWATAVEISDLLDGERTKFILGDKTKRGHFFAIASEVIARNHEGRENAFIGMETRNLQTDLQSMEDELNIMQRLSLLKQFEEDEKLQEHNVLNIFRGKNDELKLQIFPYKTAAPAIQKATELENDLFSLNAVYVRAQNPKQLRSAYRNYFNDPVDFVELLKTQVSIKNIS